MIYPKCLYKPGKRDTSTVAADEDHHKSLASQGWVDIWTDKEPNKFEVTEKVVEKSVEKAPVKRKAKRKAK